MFKEVIVDSGITGTDNEKIKQINPNDSNSFFNTTNLGFDTLDWPKEKS